MDIQNKFRQALTPPQKSFLRSEQAAPTMTGIRSILSPSVTTGLTPERLARILKAAEEGDIEAYLALAEQIEEKDPHYIAVLGTRKRAVAQMDIMVEAASAGDHAEDDAKLIRDWLARDRLEAELLDILDAIGKGFSVCEIIWDQTGETWLPKEIKWRDPRWFQFDDVDGTTLRLRDLADPLRGIDLDPYKYIVHLHKSKSGLPARGGIVRPCTWVWLFKNFSFKDWVIFSEAYGQPIRIGKYGPGASKDDRDVLLRAVGQIGSDAAAIIPDSMVIEFVETQTKSGTVDAFERFIKLCDQQMSKAVLGQTTTTDALSTGLAGNQAHDEVRADIARSDAKQLMATLNEQLIPAIINLNRGQRDAYPRIQIGTEDAEDIEKLSIAADRGVRMGLRLSEKGLIERLGLPPAENEEDTIKLPETPMPGFGPGFASAMPAVATAAAASSGRKGDSIDELVADLAGDWEEVMNPIVAEIEKAIAGARTFEELQAALLDVLPDLNMDGMADKLTKATFAARLAGATGADKT